MTQEQQAEVIQLDVVRLRTRVRELDEIELKEMTAVKAANDKRVELGLELLKLRAGWPRSGPAAKGWGELLTTIGLKQQRAHDLMRLAEDFTTPRETGNDPESPDRDTWCTPKWIAEALGKWDLDPCSNARSHIESKRAFDLEARGQNGLELASKVKASARVYVNPPYSDVLPWVRAYGHTRFCFLVKFDPSTVWCTELLANTSLILFPKKVEERSARIAFEPPPGLKASSNQFPHGLFFANAKDASKEIQAACFRFTHKA